MLETMVKGGPMMIPLAICSIVAVAVVLDRAYAFFQYRKIDNRALRAQLHDLIAREDFRGAETLCASTPGPISAVLLAGMRAFRNLPDKLRNGETIRTLVGHAMEDYSHQALSAVEKRFGVLSTVSNAAPLMGMIGTVTGMIASFEAMSAIDSGVNQAAVASGISEALITTAAGLLIAMVAVIPYNYFMGQSDAIDLEIGEASNEMMDLMIAQAHARENAHAA